MPIFCKHCKESRPDSEFVSTNKSRCLKCRRAQSRETSLRWLKTEKGRSYVRKYKTIYRTRHKQRLSDYYKGWYKENGRSRDTVKMAAHALVAKAIREGTLVRPPVCSRCSRNVRIEAHHPNYNEPLQVQWLCQSCHQLIHHSVPIGANS